MDIRRSGEWGELIDWPVVAIHSIVMQNGKVMTFGTDVSGNQGAMMVHDVWDPVTGQHQLLEHHMHTPTDIFCAAAVLLPGTNKVLIAGGDSRGEGRPINMGVNDVNVYDIDTGEIHPATDGEMNAARWYPTTIALPTGQVLILGGSDANGVGVATPEIYTPGQGWRSLPGATDQDVADFFDYPKTWVAQDGKVYYFANGRGSDGVQDLVALDPSGEGSIEKIASMPFTAAWESPAIMFDTGKVLISDIGTDLWVMDINGPTPTFEKVGTMPQERNYSDMTVLADGTVLINGGSGKDNLEAYAQTTAIIFDPKTGEMREVGDEAHSRLYHSTTVLLPDGTVLSSGGGSADNAEKTFLDSQIYKPGYLFDETGADAVRPVIEDAPKSVDPGDAFVITVDDADAIASLRMVRTGGTTHVLNVDARAIVPDFVKLDDHRIEVRLPENEAVSPAGFWMLFAWNANGVPSVAPIVSIEPRDGFYDGIGDVEARYFAVDQKVTSLDQVDFDAAPLHTQAVVTIDEDTSHAFYEGGPKDHFAVRYQGSFDVTETGSYSFYLTANDAARLTIDGQRVADLADLKQAATSTVTLTLEAGIHTIGVDHLAKTGPSVIDLDWSGPTFSRKQLTFDGLDSMSPGDGGSEVNVIAAPGGYVAGTDGADRFEGTAADDTFYGGLGDDVYRGGVGYNQVDYDGKAADYTFTHEADGTVTVSHPIYGTDTLSDIDGFWFRGEGKWYPIADLVTDGGGEGGEPGEPAEPGNDVNVIAAPGGYIEGTDRADRFEGTAQNDSFYGGLGNDIYRGGAGYNQVDYDGKASDYSFVRKADGTVTVTHPTYGTDTLTDIGGFWFRDEERWYPLDELVSEAPSDGGGSGGEPGDTVNVIVAPGGYIAGTDGADRFEGTTANDTFYGGTGNDIYLGAAGYNQVDYDGKASDYVFARKADGTVTVTHPTYGSDTLSDIGGFWFRGEEKWYPLDDLVSEAPSNGGGSGGEPSTDINVIAAPGGYVEGTDGADRFEGTIANDTFYGGAGNDIYLGGAGYNQVDYDGKAVDYVFTRNADGTMTVSHPTYGADTLSDIDGFWFRGEEKWYAFEEIGAAIQAAPAPDRLSDESADDTGDDDAALRTQVDLFFEDDLSADYDAPAASDDVHSAHDHAMA
ncbi:MAG: DUF1929 domain-containing protein [Fulvimarina manganoxydans]|uniref:galactose oxidase-like domain-containing protein n=1 Tax=Fulvimarina manganoxydans TaxID=937218 RepID=UPI0023551031|nr:galactose oxidase-like domain-containing protein [Fulvimarina manganoxydans]MCK5931606.1 DUF1929 domain-containing protein [Fulvimarina manganoxydans]